MSPAVSVSVIIPARNAAATLARALESVVAQTCRPDEIIVVDDASTDTTAALASSYPDVTVMTLASPRGAAAARNAGLRAARGQWVAFLDADDAWLPAKLERQLDRIGQENGVSLVFCASEEFAPGGISLGDTFRGRTVSCAPDAWKALLKENFVATPTVMAPRVVVLQLGGFDEMLPVGEDQDLWIRLALAGRIVYVPELLVRIYVQPDSLSAFRPADQSEYVLPMIRKHVAALRGRLAKREVRAILGERLNNAGRIAFAHGDLLRGAGYLLRAVLLGYRPLSGLVVIAKAPLGRFARWVLHGMARRQTAL